MSIIELKNPEFLNITDENGKLSFGCDQLWYPNEGFIPRGACGAATASNLLGYILRSNKSLLDIAESAGLSGLTGLTGDTESIEFTESTRSTAKKDFLEFMKQVYPFFAPRIGGLMSDDFLEGVSGFSARYDLPVKANLLNVPVCRAERPSFSDLNNFTLSALKEDMPLAFLILSSGSERVLDTWHWVTILAYNESNNDIRITDNGKTFVANIRKWHETSIMGGALVSLNI